MFGRRATTSLPTRTRNRPTSTIRGWPTELDGAIPRLFFRAGAPTQLQREGATRRVTTVAAGVLPIPAGQPRPAAVTRIASGDTRQKLVAVNKVMPLLSVVSDETIFLKENSSVFRAGATRHFHQQCCQLTGDKHILQAIAGTTLELVDTSI